MTARSRNGTSSKFLNYRKEDAIFIYTRLTNYAPKILQTLNTILRRDKLVTNMVIIRALGRNVFQLVLRDKLKKNVVRITGPYGFKVIYSFVP